MGDSEGTDTWPKIRHTECPKPRSWHQMCCVLGQCVVLFLVCRFFFLCVCVYSCRSCGLVFLHFHWGSSIIPLGLKVRHLLSCVHTLAKLALEWDLRNNDQRAMEVVTNSLCAARSLVIRLAPALVTLSLVRGDLVHRQCESYGGMTVSILAKGRTMISMAATRESMIL
jgi:hypothetical protein